MSTLEQLGHAGAFVAGLLIGVLVTVIMVRGIIRYGMPGERRDHPDA